MDRISADQRIISRLLICFDKPDILLSGMAKPAYCQKSKDVLNHSVSTQLLFHFKTLHQMNTVKDYQQKAHESVDKLFTEVDRLKQKGQHIKEDQKQLFQRRVAELDEKKEDLLQKYNQLSSSTGQATEEMKNGFEQAKDVLSNAWKKANSEFVSLD